MLHKTCFQMVISFKYVMNHSITFAIRDARELTSMVSAACALWSRRWYIRQPFSVMHHGNNLINAGVGVGVEG